ncbi:MAG TPA: hypothetical protein VKV16_01960 [Solirubrobacteraceae bacterium]|nr:hypothetical protein [Solirubrobacteraceae bacterium]
MSETAFAGARERAPRRAGARSPRRAPGARTWLARAPAWTIAAAAAVAYVIAAPPSPDLAAASYRSSLFSSAGFTLWDNSWYGGHHLPAYSLIAPALGALIGPQPLAALATVIATALFAAVIDGCFPRRATRVAAAWFAVGASIALLSSRVPFDVGLAIGLGAVLLARRGRLVAALAASLLCAPASPVAGAFLGMAFLAWALAGPARAWPAALALAALVPIALLALAFPEGGTQPFVASAFFPALLGVLVIGALIERPRAARPDQERTAGPARERAGGGGRKERGHEPTGAAGPRLLRIGAALYALALVGSYVVPSAVGGNADRLGALAAGPLAACALACASRWRRRALVVLAPALLYWQANAPLADFAAAVGQPAVDASYYAPLLGELRTLGVGYDARPARIEVVATADHWEARWLAPHVMLARGWERQLDTFRNRLFYEPGEHLGAGRYRAWLARNAVSYVALADAPLDYSARAEARLVRSGEARYLREIWHSAHWRLYAVSGARALAQPPARLTRASSDSLTLYAPRAGSYTVRVHFTPYWALTGGHGCVSRARGDWTEVKTPAKGYVRLDIEFALARVFDHGPRCN